jgi:hypothetical protein
MTLKTPFLLRRATRWNKSRAQTHGRVSIHGKILGGATLAVERGELAGARTQDPRLKRALLYQLSYELTLLVSRLV